MKQYTYDITVCVFICNSKKSHMLLATAQ